MELVVAEVVHNLIANLIADAIKAAVKGALGANFFENRRIQRSIDEAVDKVVQPLAHFLSTEKVSEAQQKLLAETCVRELRVTLNEPDRLFRGSLHGQKIFEDLYRDRPFPQEITDEGLSASYALLGPRVASILCDLPRTVEAWRMEGWRENFRRLDELAEALRGIFDRVDAIGRREDRLRDETFARVHRQMTQKTLLDLDITGLRADSPLSCKLDDLFVLPSFRLDKDASVSGPEQVAHFTQRKQRSIIVGAPGSGKSTWTKWFANRVLALDPPLLSVRVELRGLLVAPLPSLHTLIRTAAGAHLADEITAQVVRSWCERAAIVFLIDGFDEVPPERRDQVASWLDELAGAVSECSIISTSRPLTTAHLQREDDSKPRTLVRRIWQLWALEPFDHARVTEYITKWHQHAPMLADADRNVDVSALASEWTRDPTIAPLTENPLLLSTLLVVHHLDGRLPKGRSKLYQRYVDGMLGSWDSRRKVEAWSTSFPTDKRREVLRRLALEMQMREIDELSELDALAIVEAVIRERGLALSASEVLIALRERTGLIVGPGVYEFVHKTVSEFLVAEAIVDGVYWRDVRVDRFQLFKQRYEDRWNTILFLWAGMAPVPELEELIALCLRPESWDEMALALGLILDQDQRVGGATIAQAFDAVLALNIEDTGVCYTHAVPAAEDFDIDAFPCPDPPLRGLSEDTFEDALFFLSERRLDRLTSLAHLNSHVGRQLAAELFARSPSSETFRLLRASAPEQEPLRTQWLSAGLSYAFRWNRDEERFKLVWVALVEVEPRERFAPVARALFEQMMTFRHHAVRMTLTSIALILAMVRPDKIDETQLVLSSGYTDGDEVKDVLLTFHQTLKTALAQEKINATAATAKLLADTDALIARRTALLDAR